MYVDKVYTTLKDNQNKIKLSNSSTSEDEFNEAYSIMLKIIKNIVDSNTRIMSIKIIISLSWPIYTSEKERTKNNKPLIKFLEIH